MNMKSLNSVWFSKLTFGIYSSTKYCDICSSEGGNYIAARFEQIWCPVDVERKVEAVFNVLLKQRFLHTMEQDNPTVTDKYPPFYVILSCNIYCSESSGTSLVLEGVEELAQNIEWGHL